MAVHARRDPADAGPAGRRHREHFLDARRRRDAGQRRLRGGQAWRPWPDPRGGAGTGRHRDPGQRHRPGGDADRNDFGGQRRLASQRAAWPDRRAGGDRRCRGLAVLTRGLLHHRLGAGRRRRLAGRMTSSGRSRPMTTSGTSTQPRSGEPARRPGLHRELRFFETTSISVGVMAPTLAMSVTGVAAAAALGRAAPLAFAVAALGVGLVAYGFVRLAGEFSHAGSVYGFVGNTLGPRPGFLAGWALLGTYLVFPPVSVMGVAVFGRAFLATTGLAANADWYPLALGAWAVIAVLAARGVRPTTRSLLAFEIVSVCLILVLMGVIYWRLAAGTAPGGQRLSGSVFVLPPGVGLSALALAATSGFLAFAGFESAGSLGEESFAPTRAVPRAIITAVAFGAVFYVACVTAQSLGFGTGAGGVSAFRHSQAPLGDLAKRYVGNPLAALLDLGAVLSALGAGLGGVTVAARMLFSFGRDGIASRRLSRVSAVTGVP